MVGSDVILIILSSFNNAYLEKSTDKPGALSVYIKCVVLIWTSAPNTNMGFHKQKLQLRLK